jgi:hypothetical protein
MTFRTIPSAHVQLARDLTPKQFEVLADFLDQAITDAQLQGITT